MGMKAWKWDVLLFVLASPVLLGIKLWRGLRHLFLLRQAVQPALSCPVCHVPIMLIGFWKCMGCGFTYQGHVLRTCPVCQALPKMVRCHQCGATKAIHL